MTSEKSKIVAIHQPNFFPWLGYFDKLNRVDIFVVLDHVQLQKKAGSWSNRVKMLLKGEGKWVTAPIDRSYNGVKAIKDVCFHSTMPWRKKLFKTIESEYRKALFYDEVMAILQPAIENKVINLSQYNINAIKTIANKLNVDTSKIQYSSELQPEGVANDMLVSLVKSVGSDEYMCGGGADGYQDKDIFKSANITLSHQNFVHPQYEQFRAKEFVSGLSIIDPLMNLGWKGVQDLLEAS